MVCCGAGSYVGVGGDFLGGKIRRGNQTGDDLDARRRKRRLTMITKTKIALVAALVLSSAPAAFAANTYANADRDRGFTTYRRVPLRSSHAVR